MSPHCEASVAKSAGATQVKVQVYYCCGLWIERSVSPVLVLAALRGEGCTIYIPSTILSFLPSSSLQCKSGSSLLLPACLLVGSVTVAGGAAEYSVSGGGECAAASPVAGSDLSQPSVPFVAPLSSSLASIFSGVRSTLLSTEPQSSPGPCPVHPQSRGQRTS